MFSTIIIDMIITVADQGELRAHALADLHDDSLDVEGAELGILQCIIIIIISSSSSSSSSSSMF